MQTLFIQKNKFKHHRIPSARLMHWICGIDTAPQEEPFFNPICIPSVGIKIILEVITLNTKSKLFNRDFTLVVIGQIISLFGNAILRFALPLYLLNLTGSSAVFGSIMAISMIPMALLSPIGGIIADRVNRRNIMVVLDFITSGIVIIFGLVFIPDQAVVLIGVMMVLLSIIQSFYSPSVQSSIPSAFFLRKPYEIQCCCQSGAVSLFASGPCLWRYALWFFWSDTYYFYRWHQLLPLCGYGSFYSYAL